MTRKEIEKLVDSPKWTMRDRCAVLKHIEELEAALCRLIHILDDGMARHGDNAKHLGDVVCVARNEISRALSPAPEPNP